MPQTLLGTMAEPVLETARLVLRPTRAEDFEGWAAWRSDPEATRFVGGPQARSQAWRDFLTMAGAWSMQGFGMFSVIEKATGRWVGRLGPWMPEGWPGPEIGWGLSRDSWGKGYATEGAAAAIDWAFDVLGWTEVIHSIDPDNAPSQAVARRLGSDLRGPGRLPAPFEAAPIEIWGQTREQWRARRASL
ncbi:GNAT family N-acetyltransferase [Azospirillum rugosum]|uniref:RimJ/RimL family protein N-acetyltransferase n=1 Tax=Azospirillum rugosum TaxID=416170 RepID=A0ABS4SY18_9PROT|nr:GNAT family N-acetyltransferase [Azospirillum rugosum]MBP2296993.1 RimJ/RimL family protein N-acetyltransferase [Azospirillum rugosum]MDQ0530625.1 RimJ/RimL family protein N-acetyltransferase [Azospirillum rugosum]